MNSWTNNKRFLEGERVKGFFHNTPYTGIVIDSRPHSLHPTSVEMIVEFDQEIDCGKAFGKRKSGLITAFDHNTCGHTIEAE